MNIELLATISVSSTLTEDDIKYNEMQYGQ